MANQRPGRLVETLTERISRLEIEFHRAYWAVQVDATEENEKRRAELELELRKVKGDSQALSDVEEALAGETHDPVLRRQLEILRLTLTGNQMEEDMRQKIVEISSAVESDFASYRPVLGDKKVSDNEIDDILKGSNDEDERRAAWEASKEIGEVVAPRVRELARLRNQAARKLGFSDYYRMSLELQELDETWLFGLFDELETFTTEPFSRWKSHLDRRLSQRFGVTEIAPWHYGDPFFQGLPPDGRINLDAVLEGKNAPDLALKTFASWKIDLTGVIEASDLFPRANKCQHAFCLDVDRSGKDVRILANVTPGEYWTEVMLHESGHAAYDICIDPRWPYLLRRPAHTFVTEAAALLSGRLVRDPAWLESVAGVDPTEVSAIAEGLRAANATQSLLFSRWCLVMTHFERDLYSDPEADLDQRWWELVERFQLVKAPAGRRHPDWAAKIHLAVAPVYYQNYLLGDLLASQLLATIEKEFGGFIGVPAAGEFLVERVFRPGNLLRWDSLIEEATGRQLEAEDLGAELSYVL